jgi:hypothetical protein
MNTTPPTDVPARLPMQLQQELERHKSAQQKWDGDKFGSTNGGWSSEAQARNFVQSGMGFGSMRIPVWALNVGSVQQLVVSIA